MTPPLVTILDDEPEIRRILTEALALPTAAALTELAKLALALAHGLLQ